MRRGSRTTGSAVALAIGLASSAAGAQPGAPTSGSDDDLRDDGVDDEPPEPPDARDDEGFDELAADVVDEGYPELHVRRPLLLPSGGVEGTARAMLDTIDVHTARYDQIAADGRVRLGLGRFEIEAGAAVLVHSDPIEGFAVPERLRDLFVAVRHGFSPDHVLGVEVLATRYGGVPLSYRAALIYRRQDHLSPRAAVVSAVGATLWGTSLAGVRARVLDVQGRIAVEAQLARWLMVSTYFDLGGRHELDEPEVTNIETLHASMGFRVMVAATRAIDLVMDARSDSTGTVEAGTFTVGLAVRRMP